MKSFAVCFICRNILCVLTSHKTCQGKQMQPCGKRLWPTATPVFLTCSGQLFHRAELIKIPIAWWEGVTTTSAISPFAQSYSESHGWAESSSSKQQWQEVKAAASRPAAPSTTGSVTFFTFFQRPLWSHHKEDTGPLDWPYLLHACPHVLLLMVSLILSTSLSWLLSSASSFLLPSLHLHRENCFIIFLVVLMLLFL